MKRVKYSKENYNKAGIYYIICISNKLIYIGMTTVGFYRRYNSHINDLKNNRHHNKHL